MAPPAGFGAQLTLAEESGGYGVYQAPTRALDFVSESIKTARARIESKGLRARRVTQTGQWLSGARQVAGTINTELAQVGYGLVWKHCFGSIATVNNADGSYTHTATPGDLTGKSLTVQVGRPAVTGTVIPFSYVGTKITKWAISCKAGEIVTLDLDVVAQDEDTTRGLISTAGMYPNTMAPLSFVSGFLQLGGTQVDVKDCTISGDNHLDAGRLFLRNAATVKEPLENDLREYTGSCTADFTDQTLYNHYVNADEVALVLNFQGALISGSRYYTTVVSANVRFDSETPVVAGPNTLAQPLTFKGIANTSSDSSACAVAYTTTDATP